MKIYATSGYTFTPSSATLDLSAMPGFVPAGLLAVINQTRQNAALYTASPAGPLGTFTGSVLSLSAPVGNMSAGDSLLVIYDDGSAAARDGTPATGVTAPAGAVGVLGWLSSAYPLLGAIRDRLPASLVGGRLSVDGSGVVQPVSGSAAAGAAPTQPPLSVSGVDAGGLKRHLLTDIAGRLLLGANPPRVSNTAPLAAQSATVTLAVDGMATGVAQITGTWAGSVSWAGSVDGGTTYFAMNVTPFGAGGGASIAAATANGQWEFSAAGLTHVQATMTAWTSGSASVLLAASSGGKIARVKAPAGDPLPIFSPIPTSVVTGQVKIATTGTAVPLPSYALVNGLVIKAKTTNAAQTGAYSGMVGPAGVTTIYDGTGTGYPLAPGEPASFAVPNSNLIYVNGTAGDVFSFEGN